MTAEVAVLNRHAIALATDSAVTLTYREGEKVFNSVNKLFALQKVAPVGVMIYGEAEFMEIPWEPLLKVYRTQLKRKCFDTIDGYADDLLEFVRKHPLTNEPKRQERAFETRATQFFLTIRRLIQRAMEEEEFAHGKQASKVDLATIAHGVVGKVLKNYEEIVAKFPVLQNFPKDVVAKRQVTIEKVRRAVLRELPLTRAHKLHIFKLFERVMQSTFLTDFTGLVVAGYGESEMFPSLVSMQLDGVYDGHLRCTRATEAIDGKTSAVLIPFAQADVVTTFMNGMHPDLDQALHAAITGLMNTLPSTVAKRVTLLDRRQSAQLNRALKTIGRQTVEMFMRYTTHFKEQIHRPVTSVLAYMPKEEMADLAESLVHLTSTRRRVALGTETVGGPIDVAVITKGDGFIWLKRKHYFRPELNPQFFAKMLQEGRL